MKKKIVIICCSALAILIIASGVLMISANNSAPLDGKSPAEAGKLIGTTLRKVIEENKKPFDSENEDPNRVVGEFYGEKVTAKELDYRAAFYQLSDSANPLKEAWESLIAEKYIFKVAKENSLTPSQDELVKFSQEMRKDVESAPSGKEYVDGVCEGFGLTPDEYWNDYKVKHEAPFDLSSQRVAAFWTEKNIPQTTMEEMLAPYKNVPIKDKILIKKY